MLIQNKVLISLAAIWLGLAPATQGAPNLSPQEKAQAKRNLTANTTSLQRHGDLKVVTGDIIHDSGGTFPSFVFVTHRQCTALEQALETLTNTVETVLPLANPAGQKSIQKALAKATKAVGKFVELSDKSKKKNRKSPTNKEQSGYLAAATAIQEAQTLIEPLLAG
jgi:hypothetical protein